MKPAYYNEFDEKAAAWLRELIRRGLIAPGDVDTRSILDVRPDDLRRYGQCHFFAGIGVWSHALRRAGWSDDRAVWTGSCPCQPFSAAGKGAGFDDERHLWPAFFHLIGECRPDVVFGEQVASKDGLTWLNLVQADLEGAGYASGAVDTCAAGFGAPHIRQRLYWAADALLAGRAEGRAIAGDGSVTRSGVASGLGEPSPTRFQERVGLGGISDGQAGADAREAVVGASVRPGRLADSDGGDASAERQQRGRQQRQQSEDGGAVGRVGDAIDQSCERNAGSVPGSQEKVDGTRFSVDGAVDIGFEHAGSSVAPRPGPTNGLWRDPDWLFCRDGKWRPVEPGTFPLAHGAPARVGRLRGYGNAINAEQAQSFIEAYLETRGDVGLT